MRIAITSFILSVLLIVVFSLLVYPTIYKYVEADYNGNNYPIKINRFTGETFVYVPGKGFQKDQPSNK